MNAKLTLPGSVLAALLLASACSSSGSNDGPASLPAGDVIGETMAPRPIHRFAVVDATPAKFYEQTLLVEATVKAVCLKKGCWMMIEDEGRVARVRWESGCGGKYTFPMDATGKRVLVQGSFYPSKLSEEAAEHMEEESGGTAKIPREGYEFNASAVMLLPSKS